MTSVLTKEDVLKCFDVLQGSLLYRHLKPHLSHYFTVVETECVIGQEQRRGYNGGPEKGTCRCWPTI